MFLISFDIPKEFNALRLRVFRKLRKLNAEIVHESLWKSNSLESLTNIALLIRQHGGSAKILEEKFIL